MMSSLSLRAGAAPLAIVIALFVTSEANAHAVCGNRVFPATLAIDDPGVGDELAFPTLAYTPPDADGTSEFDASFEYSKTLTDKLAFSIGDGLTWLNSGEHGSENIETALKYEFMCDDAHEFMASAAMEVAWANTGSGGFSDPFNTYSPALDFGKGFGDLPASLSALRPFAITSQLGLDIPGQASTDGELNPTVLNWGFTFQYSLPYLNANVSEIKGPEFLKHLIFVTEAAFETPVGNIPDGGGITTGFIQPGIIYEGDSWQLALEASIPINSDSGHGVGFVGELHFFFDDIFPNSLGKPLFGGKS
jgi:hypothetical protein